MTSTKKGWFEKVLDWWKAKGSEKGPTGDPKSNPHPIPKVEPLEEPDRPSASETGEVEIIDLPQKIETHGHYRTKTGNPRGLVVHYTAGRSLAGEKNAEGTLGTLAKKGLGCLTMDIFGNIYKSKYQDLNQVAWHAGKSEWLGKTSISRECMGMEICCAGKLDNDGKSWFGKKYDLIFTRKVQQKDNVKEGRYLKFTKEQEESLLNFCLWQLKVNPEFSIDWVVGHDEIAPTRKSDPGGSLSMTMPEFRQKLRKLSGK